MISLLTICAALAADVDTFTPSGSMSAGQGTPQGEAGTLGEPGWATGVTTTVVRDPVVRIFKDGSKEAAVAGLVGLQLQGSRTLGKMARVDVFAPVYPYVDSPVSGFRGPALGDARVQALIPVWTRFFAVVPRVELPTGSTDALVSGGFRVGATGVASDSYSYFGWVFNVGGSYSAVGDGVIPSGSQLDALAGGWLSAPGLGRLGVEVDAHNARAGWVAVGSTFVQTNLGKGPEFSLNVGRGFLSGVGAPAFRAGVGVSWTPPAKEPRPEVVATVESDPLTDEFLEIDPDLVELALVEIEAELDAEPALDEPEPALDEPESVDEPEPTLDEPEPALDEPALEPEPEPVLEPAPEPEPEMPGEIANFEMMGPQSDGYLRPAMHSVPFSEDLRASFASGRVAIDGDMRQVLDQMADVLHAWPEISLVEIAGHSDSVGGVAANVRLSEDRAEMIRAYLLGRGITAERMIVRGYGPSEPVESNATPAGRLVNRRVELRIRSLTPTEESVVLR